MAETFVAVKSGPGGFTQRVCLKLVLPFFRDDETFIRLFYREATLAAKLRHRNIVGVMDFGEFEGTPYMALELVDGLDLRAILDGQQGEKLPADYVTLFGLELADALVHAHNLSSSTGSDGAADEVRGIVHRDISPSNVLVSRQGEILLTDFGVAKAISDTSRKQSAVKGKVPYMSPEQLRAESPDGRADLFALGVVLFEALAGERPYQGPHDIATSMMILKGEHRALEELAPDAPQGLCNVIERLIDPDKERRPATAAALIEELDEFAPSPRVRQNLGRLVMQLAEQAEHKRAKRGSGSVGAKTELLPDSDAGSAAPVPLSKPSSGVERSSSAPMVPDEIPAAPISDEDLASQPLNLVRPPRGAAPRADARGSGLESLDASLTTWRDGRRPGQEGERPRRKLWLALAGSILALGVVASAAVMFWPSGDGTDASEAKVGDAETERASERKTRAEELAKEPEPIAPEPEPEQERPPAAREEAAEKQAPDPRPAAGEPEPEPPPAKKARTRPEEETKKLTRRVKPPSPEPRPEPQAKKPGRLTISVFPWGNIWINGKPWGPSPLKGEALPPGTYKISVGQAGPTKTQVVRLKAGRRKSVHFDLTAD